MGSYIHDNTQIFFTGSVNHDNENQRAQQYTINITELLPEQSFIMWANRNYSQTGFKVGSSTRMGSQFALNGYDLKFNVSYDGFMVSWLSMIREGSKAGDIFNV